MKNTKKIIQEIIIYILILIASALFVLILPHGNFIHPKAGQKYRYLDNGNPFEPKLTNQVICYSNHWVLYSNYLGYVNSERESHFYSENTLIK